MAPRWVAEACYTRSSFAKEVRSGEAIYDEIDAEAGRSNIDIEKHLRRAELKLAQANAWLAMARELHWQRDDYGTPAR
jgi:hypothetical protein